MASVVSVLVVMLHSFGPMTLTEPTNKFSTVFTFINGVMGLLRMPTFFFISGYLFLHTNPETKVVRYSTLIRKKTIRLLFPFLIFQTIAFMLWSSVHIWLKHLPYEVTIGSYLVTMADPWNHGVMFYWFLQSLFLIFLLAPPLRIILLQKKWPLLAAITCAFLILRWNAKFFLPTAFGLKGFGQNLFFFWVGMLAWSARRRWTATTHPIMAVWGVAAVVAFYIFFQGIENYRYIRFLAIGSGIYSLYFFVEIYIRRGWTFLRFLDGKTYQIYLLAWFPQQLISFVLYEHLHYSATLCHLLMLFSGLLLPLLARYLVERFVPKIGWIIGIGPRRLATFPATTPIESIPSQAELAPA